MKLAIIIIADARSGSEEAAGRVFNALSLAQEARRKGDKVEINFIGTGTRWPAELAKVGHPFHALYDSVRDTVEAASRGCALVFGATEGVEAGGIAFAENNPVDGTPGLLSVRHYLADGWHTLVF